MGKYNDDLNKLNDTKSKKKSPPKIKKCSYSGCPMNAAVYINGRYSCCFHTSSDYHHDVTIAIRNAETFLDNYNTMVKWRVKDWQDHKAHLMNHKFVPMLETETPSLYLVKFFRFITAKISNEASETVKRRLDNCSGDFDEV